MGFVPLTPLPLKSLAKFPLFRSVRPHLRPLSFRLQHRASLPLPTRRDCLRWTAAALLSALVPSPPVHSDEISARTKTPFETYTDEASGYRFEFPRGWFRVRKGEGLIAGDFSDVIVATFRPHEVGAGTGAWGTGSEGNEAAAWDLVNELVGGGGRAVYLKTFEAQGPVLQFEFDVDMTLPNGDIVSRRGVGRALGMPGGKKSASLIVTAPKEKWDSLSQVVEGVVESLRI